MSEQRYAPIKKNILNEYRLSVKGPIMEKMGATRESGLRISVLKNNPRFDVFTHVPNDKDNGVIRAPMDGTTFFAILEKLKEMVKGPNDVAVKVVNLTGPPNNKVVMSTTMFGKDKKGVMWMSVTADDRPQIKFKLLPSDYHHFRHKDGEVFTEDEASITFTKGFIKMFSGLVSNVMQADYVEPEPYNAMPKGKQYNNSGYGNNSNPNAGYDKKEFNKPPQQAPEKTSSDAAEDDLSF